ncbi:MAG: redoxin domain-containing protein [Bacteroidales bacterium]|nr:redoxin domain-containing protein [Bacteroidales bacterium]
MNTLIFRFATITFFLSILFSLTGQTIAIKNFDRRGQQVIFASHYGNSVYEISKLYLDENGFGLIYNQQLNPGIYYLVFNDSSTVEFLYDSLYRGKITIEGTGKNNFLTIDGPAPTKLFDDYTKQLLNNNKGTASNDSITAEFAAKLPGSLLELYLNAQQKIKLPEYFPPEEIINKDSAIWMYQLNYYAQHYFDRVDFTDSRLIYTPVYTNLIDGFFEKATQFNCTALIQNSNMLIEKCSVNPLYLNFTVHYLLQYFGKRKNLAEYECAYLHIIKNYFLEKAIESTGNDDIVILAKEYNRRKPASIGEIAPNIRIPETNIVAKTLHQLDKSYTILYFYSYDCPLCEKVTPEIKKLLHRYNYIDVGVFAVCTGNDAEKWKEYTLKNKLGLWTNIFDAENFNNTALAYNLNLVPALFLLDNEKRIIGKNLNTRQLEKYLFEIASGRL